MFGDATDLTGTTPTAGLVLLMFNFGKGLYCLVKGLHIPNWRNVETVGLSKMKLSSGPTYLTGAGKKSMERTYQLLLLGLRA